MGQDEEQTNGEATMTMEMTRAMGGILQAPQPEESEDDQTMDMTKAVGIKAPVACAPDMSFFAQIFSSACDWPISMLGWIYTLFFIFLGCTAA